VRCTLFLLHINYYKYFGALHLFCIALVQRTFVFIENKIRAVPRCSAPRYMAL